MRMPPLPADSIHARACKLKCEKILTRPREVTVRCTYTDGGAEAKELVQGSFRAFLARELNKDTPGGNSCTWR